MSSDKITSQQRKGIHDRARSLGYSEGVRSGINQLTMYMSPEKVGELALPLLGVVLDTMSADFPAKKRFDWVAWEDMGVDTLGDLYLLNPNELIATQSNYNEGLLFSKAIIGALAVFNMKPDN